MDSREVGRYVDSIPDNEGMIRNLQGIPLYGTKGREHCRSETGVREIGHGAKELIPLLSTQFGIMQKGI